MEESQDGSRTGRTKTWGFRRTTLARREFLEEVGELLEDAKPVPSRRGGRQPRGRGRAKQATETTPTPASKRGRGSRKSLPNASLASVSAETTTEADSEVARLESSDVCEVGPVKTVPTENQPLSEGTTDSEEISLKEYAERLKRRKLLEGKKTAAKAEAEAKPKANGAKVIEVIQIETSTEEEEVAVRETGKPPPRSLSSAGSSHPICADSEDGMLIKRRQKPARGVHRSASKFPDTEDEEGERKEDDTEGEESPEGCESEDTDPDAVYCLCRQKHNKRFMICCDRCEEWFHGDCVGISEKRGRLMEMNREDYICPNCSPCASPVPVQTVQTALSATGMMSSSESLMSPPACEDRPSEDEGIKGKIRKASSEGTKKKFKIFQPGVTSAVVEEEQALPKCIGPGCTKSALPDSVYCGHECILRHAAVTMKSLSEQKTPKLEPLPPQANPTPKALSKPTILSALKAQMKPLLGKVARKRSSGGQQGEGEDHGADKEKEAAVLPSTQTEAVRAQQTSAIDSSVFYKSNKKAAQNVDSKTERDDLGRSQSPSEVTVKPGHNAPLPASRTVQSDFNLLPLNSKPTVQLASDSTASRQQTTAAHGISESLPLLPKKSPEQSPPSSSASSPTSASVTASKSQQGPQAPQMPSEQKPKPNNQIRLNIRRSLTEILWKRVNDSDDLALSEGEVGNLAVNIEKAMYSMYLSTDGKYKNKYRLILFNLKDPKNKVLFYQVIKGEISPSKLIRLTQDELQAREQSSPNISKPPEAPQSSPAMAQMKQDVKEESPPGGVTEKTTQLSSVAARKSEDSPSPSTTSHSGIKLNQPTKMPSVPDFISSMLKDTTSEHKTHLFDLKCRICTGQISADDNDEPGAKRLKKSEPEEKQETSHKERPPKMSRGTEKRTAAPIVPRVKSPVMESPASPVPEDTPDTGEESSDFTPIVIPEVSIVSITRQDPRTAGFHPAVKPRVHQPPITPSPPTTPVISAPKPVKPPLPPPPPIVPKSILMKPTGSSIRLYSTSRTPASVVSSQPPPDKDTRHFLLKQETIWKGFLNMQTVAKFVTKGYLVSGSSKYLNEDIPDTIHIGGRILPQTVWEYVERVKASPSKDLCLIRFQPATDEEEVAYVSLFSYFNSRRRFGVVSNHCKYIKDFYLIPLGAHESVPSLLLPLEGPGFEQKRPNLLLGLAVCQKPKLPEALKEEANETRVKTQIASESSDGGFPTAKTATASVTPNDWQPYDPEIPISTTPPGSPDSSSSGSVSSPSDLAHTVLSIIKAPTAASSKPISASDPSVSAGKNPLQTILKTLFGKKEEPSVNAMDSPKQSSSVDIKSPAPNTAEVDLIVQKYGHTDISTDTPVENIEISKDDDRPYDPEEEYEPEVEYDPEVEYGMLNQTSTIPVMKEIDNEDDRPYDPEEYDPAVGYDNSKTPVKAFEDKTVVQQPTIEDDVAYDPEDSTFFEEMQADLGGNAGNGTVVLSDQQRMLLDLNKQIEEQKRQLEEQEEALSRQRAAAGMSMAHFSVSDALLSPPRTSYLSNCDLLQLAEKQTIDTVDRPVINQRRDPRQRRESKCVDNKPVESEHGNKNTTLGSSKSETIQPEKHPLTTDIQTAKQGTESPASPENKTSTEKTKTKMSSTEKVDEKVRADKREFTKTDTHKKASRLKTETREQSGDASRHSHHHRSRHESRRTSQGERKDVSPRKRQRSGDSHEVKPSQPSSVSVKQSENNKHHDRERFEHRGSNISLSKQTSRRQQRWEGPRECETISDMAQRGATFSASEDKFKEQVPLSKQTSRRQQRWEGPRESETISDMAQRGATFSASEDKFKEQVPLSKQTSRRQQRWEGPRESETISDMAQRGATFSAPEDKFKEQDSLSKQTSRRQQRWEGPRECETISDMAQRGATFSAPEDKFKEQGSSQNTRPRGPPSRQFSDPDCRTQHTLDRPFNSNQCDAPHPPEDKFKEQGSSQNTRPRGPPSRQFSDPDCRTQHTLDRPFNSNQCDAPHPPEDKFKEQGSSQNTQPRGPPSRQFSDPDCRTQHTWDRPFNSNQYDGPHPPMCRPGPRGPFGQPPQGLLENRGPRPPGPGPPGPPNRQFNVSHGPRMPNVDAPWRSNNNSVSDFNDCHPFHDNDIPAPPHMFRDNHGEFSFGGAPTEHPEMHRGGDLEWGKQRTHLTPNRFDQQHGRNTPERIGPGFCGPGPSDNYRNREMIKNRSAVFPGPHDMSVDPRAPLHHFPKSGSPQFTQTFEEQSPHHLDHYSPRDCPPFPRPRDPTSGPFLGNKGQPGLCLDKPNCQSDALPRRHSGPLLPTPPGGPTGPFNPTMQHPPQNVENPWPPQNPPGGTDFDRDFDRDTSGSDNTKNLRENKDPSPYHSHEYTREQSEERRMSDGGFPRQRGRRPWPREQGWKRSLSRGRGFDKGKGGDTGESEGEARRPKGGQDRDYAKRARIRNRHQDHDRDSHSSSQEDRNQSFHERTGRRGQKDGGFKAFGRKRGRGRERNR
ncbi:death-inducer obliterator 1-like isoform X2 [Sardina pilchardus]|uniref:death-inducer obliterator 1-like isoform X2 n=1 Tax=Sardina pilchardus TaxID=27697 RepID=UPI002E1375AF